MSVKYVYVRDRKNIQTRPNGTTTRGNPIAIVGTEIDRERNAIYYAVASTHKKDHFVKERAREIVCGRLNVLGGDLGNTDRGVLSGDEVKRVLELHNGHEITKLIMKEVIRLSKLPSHMRKVPTRVGRLCEEWLKYAQLAKAEAPTEPQLPQDDEEIIAPAPLPHA